MPASRLSNLSFLSGRAGLLAGSAALLSACAAVPDLGPQPVVRAPDSIAAERSLQTGNAAQWPSEGWWTAYGDPQLDALIQEGLKGSPDVAAAAARFAEANAVAQQSGAPLLPTVDLDANAGATKSSYNMGMPKEFVPKGWLGMGRVGLNFGLDLDIWGRNRAALAAATSQARAAEIDARQARLALATGVADAYADLARLYDERDIQGRALEIRAASQKLVADRRANGLETRGSERQADATVSSAKAQLAAADQAIAVRRHQIAALIGAGPDRGLAIARPRLGKPGPLGLPADVTTNLVARRPDIAAALARTEAAARRIKVARADFFPAIRLNALIGVQSLGYQTVLQGAQFAGGPSPFTDTLFKKDSLFGNAGPAISLPIFHGGALSGQYRGARAVYDQAVANYDKTVLGAYQQVADAVTGRQALDQRLADARAALVASEEAYGIARQRYEGGLNTYLDVLNVENQLLAARQSVAELEASAFTLDIALIRALGGGFAANQARQLPKDTPHG
ncbi:RND efflux system, outer membrane lipoprotein, NodT family [Sphingobium chlorophenolicum L-1]|uniref:RND efflux system, outer membrane lipoprotein, NodT family n=1 Tax=Sphingobium chlorophenolicum L-1 TaxID=690566 RepID=F6F0H6_SPHCR|nr:efflux transporter outer membrane subunit [Sphingobium chlorophenolicum]AEG49414.1 RND efflux system, outer membrane lipoprotein, NodT family [Sphingobium chlorophenolicum L-1]